MNCDLPEEDPMQEDKVDEQKEEEKAEEGNVEEVKKKAGKKKPPPKRGMHMTPQKRALQFSEVMGYMCRMVDRIYPSIQ